MITRPFVAQCQKVAMQSVAASLRIPEHASEAACGEALGREFASGDRYYDQALHRIRVYGEEGWVTVGGPCPGSH